MTGKVVASIISLKFEDTVWGYSVLLSGQVDPVIPESQWQLPKIAALNP